MNLREYPDIANLISTWSIRPQPGTPAGDAWEHGARQGWEWVMSMAQDIAEEQRIHQDAQRYAWLRYACLHVQGVRVVIAYKMAFENSIDAIIDAARPKDCDLGSPGSQTSEEERSRWLNALRYRWLREAVLDVPGTSVTVDEKTLCTERLDKAIDGKRTAADGPRTWQEPIRNVPTL
jgi:hypothetical protein